MDLGMVTWATVMEKVAVQTSEQAMDIFTVKALGQVAAVWVQAMVMVAAVWVEVMDLGAVVLVMDLVTVVWGKA